MSTLNVQIGQGEMPPEAVQVPILPDGSNCPHAPKCLKHRMVTMAMSMIASCITVLIASCAFTFSTPTFTFRFREPTPNGPSFHHPPEVSPVSGEPTPSGGSTLKALDIVGPPSR